MWRKGEREKTERRFVKTESMVVAVKFADDSFPSVSRSKKRVYILSSPVSTFSSSSSSRRTCACIVHVRALERESHRISHQAPASRVAEPVRAQSQSAGPPGPPVRSPASPSRLPRKSNAVHLSPSFARLLWRYVQTIRTCCSRAKRERTRERKGGKKKRPRLRADEREREAGKERKGKTHRLRRDGYTTHAPVAFADIFVSLSTSGDLKRASRKPVRERVSISRFSSIRTCMYVHTYLCMHAVFPGPRGGGWSSSSSSPTIARATRLRWLFHRPGGLDRNDSRPRRDSQRPPRPF